MKYNDDDGDDDHDDHDDELIASFPPHLHII